jgi:predicted ArsR family transcriptional regulator
MPTESLKVKIFRAMMHRPFTTTEMTLRVYGTATKSQKMAVCHYLSVLKDDGILRVSGKVRGQRGRPATVWQLVSPRG